MRKFFDFLLNILWFFLAGLVMAVSLFLVGLVTAILIIPLFFGIPQIYFNAIPLAFAPAGKKVTTHFSKAPLRNILALILGGLIMDIMYIIVGLLFCITIVGIPLGKQCFKLGKYWLAPFGATVE